MSAEGEALRPRQVAVVGAGGAQPGSEVWELAEAVGRGLAEANPFCRRVIATGIGHARNVAEAVAAALAALPR